MLDFNMGERSWIHTSVCNCNSIWIWTRSVEWSDATDLAECMLSWMCTKSICCEVLFGISKKLKPFRRDNEVDVSPHGAIRTVALPNYNTAWCLSSPSHSSTMTSTVMHYPDWIHPKKKNSQLFRDVNENYMLSRVYPGERIKKKKMLILS